MFFSKNTTRITFFILSITCIKSFATNLNPRTDVSLKKITVNLNKISNNTNMDLIIKNDFNDKIIALVPKNSKNLSVPIDESQFELKKYPQGLKSEYKLSVPYLGVYDKNNTEEPIAYLAFNVTETSVEVIPNFELFTLSKSAKKEILSSTKGQSISLGKLESTSPKFKTTIIFEPNLKNSKFIISPE